MLLWAKLAGAGVLLLAIIGFYFHYQHIKDEAARVPILEEQVRSANARANSLAEDLEIERTRRDVADVALTAWQENKNEILRAIGRLPRPAVATVAACAPSDADRLVRNDALGRLIGTGPAGGPATLPAAPGAPDGED